MMSRWSEPWNEPQTDIHVQEYEKLSTEKLKENASHNEFIFDWLETNYENKQESCLPRCVLYAHYMEFCKRNTQTPVGAATFGKIIRQKFPTLTTRRLGTRGQSKYHYFGLAIKLSSIYNARKHFGKGLTRFTTSTRPYQHERIKKCQSSTVLTVLDGFPKVWKTPGQNLSKNLVEVQLFLVMYKAHCQRMLDAIVAGNFGEVENFLLHFWHRMPDHVSKNLEIDAISEVVTACDISFYKKLLDVLLPDSIRDIPESFKTEIINFTKSFLPWLDICLINVPKKLANTKMEVAKMYIKIIQRHLSFLKLAKNARAILADNTLKFEIIEDMEETDFEAALEIAKNRNEGRNEEGRKQNFDVYFKNVLQYLGRQASVEAFTFLLDKVLYDWVIKPAESSKTNLKQRSTDFILQWSQFVAKFMKDLTLRSASSFSSIHLLTVMAMEYIFLVVEVKLAADQEKGIWQKIKSYAVVDKVNKTTLTEVNGGRNKREGKRKRKSQPVGLQHPLKKQNHATNIVDFAPIHFPLGFSEELDTSTDSVIQSNIFEPRNQFFEDFSHVNTYDISSGHFINNSSSYLPNYPSNYFVNSLSSYFGNSYSGASDCAYENTSCRMENMPTMNLQNMPVNANWDDNLQQDISQYYPYLKELNDSFEVFNVLGW